MAKKAPIRKKSKTKKAPARKSKPKLVVGSLPVIGQYLVSANGFVGAIVASLDGKGLDALIVASNAERKPYLLEDMQYGCYGTEIKGADSLTDGQANTDAMAKAGSELAKKILALKAFLPAKHDLMAIYANCKHLNLFPDAWFWSSTQFVSSYAWLQHFSHGYVLSWRKDNAYKAFPVRRVRIQ